MSSCQEYGIRVVRMLNDQEQDLLKKVYRSVEKDLVKERTEIIWQNLFLNNNHCFQHDSVQELDAWIKSLLDVVFHDWPQVHILSYGFILNAAGTGKNQNWHYDYTVSSANLFVPLTRITYKNATQFLEIPLRATKKTSTGSFEGDLEDFFESEGIDAVVVKQVICKPFCLLKMLPGTPHRGIGNSDNYDRVLFWVTVDNHYHELKEGYQVVSSFYDDKKD